MYTDNRNAYRQSFFDAWQKYQKQLPLSAVEAQMADVIALHPEYHALLSHERCLNDEFALEENPFFHLSLHMSLLDQIRLDQPARIRSLYEQLMQLHADKHAVMHQMMQCLAQCLWHAQQTGQPPNEADYLNKVFVILSEAKDL